MLQQQRKRLVESRTHRHALIAIDKFDVITKWAGQIAGASDLLLDRAEFRGGPFAWRSPGAARARRRRPGNSRRFTMLDNQSAGCDQAGDFRVPKFIKQPENVPVNRLFPDPLT